MPIKFRCQHCQQLLGISRSRANAVVDCPRCGRSLRVPDLDGRTRRLPDPASSVKHDSQLMSALSELSSLDDEAATAGQTETADRPADDVFNTRTPLDPGPAPQREPVDMNVAVELPVVEPEPSEEAPIAIEESLEELAALANSSSGGPVSQDLLDDMRQARQAPRRRFYRLMAAILIFTCGFLAGRFTFHTKIPQDTSADSFEQNGRKPESEPAEQLPLAPAAGEAETERVIQGTVKYQDRSGEMRPDVGATVLLLPPDRNGSWILNARSLQKPPDDPDHRAVRAALSTMNAAFTKVQADGHFVMTADLPQMATIVVVSNHVERMEDVPVSESILNLLRLYFDSTTHICGQRSVRSVQITEQTKLTESIDVVFPTSR